MPEFINNGIGIFGLGPYLNVLPLVTVALFLVTQKMSMPAPTNEQAAMQQKMMKYMTIFMGLLFYKVASGLCLYFIASSLWGIAERKLLPKTQTADAAAAGGASGSAPGSSGKRPGDGGPKPAPTAARAQEAAQGEAEEIVESRESSSREPDDVWLWLSTLGSRLCHVLRSRRHDLRDRHRRRRRGARHGASQRAGRGRDRRPVVSSGRRPARSTRLRQATRRCSGQRVESILDALCHGDLPCDLFLWPTDRSYTRQPVAELHTLGSPPLLEALLAAVCRAGARLAEPGEFTLRAFLAGRLDLTQAEAVLGVIDAHGERRACMRRSRSWPADSPGRCISCATNLLQLLAELEAGLDFVEEDIEFISRDEVVRAAASRPPSCSTTSPSRWRRGIDGGRAAAGRARRPAQRRQEQPVQRAGRTVRHSAMQSADNDQRPALVSPQRGTTRDYLTATIELDGMRCELVDTAGIDEHRVERRCIGDRSQLAQALAVERRNAAAIRVCCVEASRIDDRDDVDRLGDCDVVV